MSTAIRMSKLDKPALQLASSERGSKLVDLIRTKERVATHMELDMHLMRGGTLPITRSGTIIIHAGPGEAFGSEVSFFNYIYKVPQKLQRRSDCAIILEHPDIRVETVGESYVLKGRIKNVISDFPSAFGWYRTEKITGIPSGVATSRDDPEARYFFKLSKGHYIGAVARGTTYSIKAHEIAALYSPDDSGLHIAFVRDADGLQS